MSGRQLIRMRGIVKRFYIGQPNELEILHGIDLDVKEGEFVSIVGASGSGKSTLMNMIGVLDRLAERQATLRQALLDAGGDVDRLVELDARLRAVVAEKDELELEWLSAAEAVEGS